ncbi:hypothetical protein [Aquimarina rubra]|uniref:Secreted protein n=1 Tax=Aquimarina rubra TaxID=1920033 RepID=A0ABW5L8K8_9FLAO
MTRRIKLLLVLLISFGISTSQEMNEISKIEGVYQGQVEDGYSFCYKTGSGLEKTWVFNEVLSVILERHLLHPDKEIGDNFIISFIKHTVIDKEMTYEVSTILRLQKLVPGQHLRK